MAKKQAGKRVGDMRLWQHSNGYYYIEVARNQSVSLKTKDKAEAERLFALRVGLVTEQKVVRLARAHTYRLGEFRNEYLAYREGQQALDEIASDTLRNDGNALNSLLSTIGDVLLRQIDTEMVRRYQKLRLAGAKNPEARKGGINSYIRHLTHAFAYALERGYIEKNPFKKTMLKREGALPKYFKAEDLRTLLAYLEKARSEIEAEAASCVNEGQRKQLMSRAAGWRDRRYMILTYLYTGARRAELMNLTWQDVDVESGYIVIQRGKGKKTRVVPMPDSLIDMFREMGVKDLGRVFPRWSSASSITHMFASVAEGAGLSLRKLHSLRHSYATHLLAHGATIDTIRDNLGHTQRSTTEVYAKVLSETQKKQTKGLKF